MRSHLYFAGPSVVLATALAWLGASPVATAIDVKGSLRAAPGAAAKVEPTRASYWHEWNGFLQPRDEKLDLAREVAVVLVGKQGSSDSATLEFRGGDLAPRTVVVQAGASLRLRNTDDTSHALYAEGLEAFGPDETRAGAGRQVRLEKAGSWPLRDQLASHVRGHLHVLEKLSAVATPGADGTFTFSDVPAGKYTVKIFYGPDEVSSKPLEVPSSGKSVTLDPLVVTPKAR